MSLTDLIKTKRRKKKKEVRWQNEKHVHFYCSLVVFFVGAFVNFVSNPLKCLWILKCFLEIKLVQSHSRYP